MVTLSLTVPGQRKGVRGCGDRVGFRRPFGNRRWSGFGVVCQILESCFQFLDPVLGGAQPLGVVIGADLLLAGLTVQFSRFGFVGWPCCLVLCFQQTVAVQDDFRPGGDEPGVEVAGRGLGQAFAL